MRQVLGEIAGNWFTGANAAEAALWGLIGLCFLGASVRPRLRMMKLVAAAAFLAFGASDIVEIHTGAWWKPWWLLAWKASCLAVMLGLLVEYLMLARRHR